MIPDKKWYRFPIKLADMYICHTKCLHHSHAKLTTGVQLYENTLWLQNLCLSFVWLYLAIARFLGESSSSPAVWSNRNAERVCCRGDLREECGAEEALTWVENLHSGIGVWMLFMDHLSADLLSKNLRGEQKGIQVINISLDNNWDTNLTMDTELRTGFTDWIIIKSSYCRWSTINSILLSRCLNCPVEEKRSILMK